MRNYEGCDRRSYRLWRHRLIRLLRQHRHVSELSVFSSSQAGMNYDDIYPHVQDIYQGVLKSVDAHQLADEYDVIFVSAPPGVAAELMEYLIDGQAKVIDLSGDFRLLDGSIYEDWYGRPAAKSSLVEKAVYGLSEWNREDIAKAKLIANPGCYPTAVLLGLAPLAHNNVIDTSTLIIDAKSGTTGAGKNPSEMTHFAEMNDSFKVYKVNQHKHTPEIEQQLEQWVGFKEPITFTPHLVPMSRGIMATMYAKVDDSLTKTKVEQIYRDAYEKNTICSRNSSRYPATKEVYGSNFTNISYHLDERTGRITVISVIDNLVKGAAGQAIQNMNLMQGFEETEGLWAMPVYP
ncbi:LOW QUALITY PROTEIN: N-acetyl-gamma-glutamyl-phosphate reductase [Geomicrobium sp. JCM 19055]|nr:LOW QUALITY PROTEIN: N-acetyl-gamma-glutamyl-phosphate reductase [Geomicrobium sp. JCM 19055]